MIEIAANLMAERLRELPFLQTVCGLAVPQKYRDGDAVKTLPACEPLAGSERVWLVPDSKLSSIAYFEMIANRATDFLSNDRGGIYDAVLRCVVWLNNDRLSPKYSTPSAMSAVLSKLQGRYGDFPPVSELRVWAQSEPIRSVDAIFGKWTYDESELQYLMPPYAYFAFDFQISYVVQSFCPAPVAIKEPCC